MMNLLGCTKENFHKLMNYMDYKKDKENLNKGKSLKKPKTPKSMGVIDHNEKGKKDDHKTKGKKNLALHDKSLNIAQLSSMKLFAT